MRACTNELASRLQEPLEALADLLVGKIFAALQRFLAKLYSVGEAAFLFEIPGHDLQYKFIQISTLPSG
jgi:hypothetical protein